ncbi:MAG: acyltransferase family protein [Solirubrobacterales bacterium]
MRGVAALAVFLHHAWPTALHPRSSTDALAVVGTQLRLGLFLFFVLSGFLLYRGFIRHLRQDTQPDLGRYLKRRAARILPAYYFAVLGSFILFSLTDARAHLPPAEHLPLFAVFAQNYSASTFKTLDSPTWTLCIEAAFYLLLPVLAVALLRIRAGWRFQAAVISGLVAIGIAWAAATAALGAGVVWSNMLPVWLPYFAFGMAVALWIEYAQPRRIEPKRTGGLVALGMALVIANGALLGLAGEGSTAAVLVADLPAGAGFALITALALVGSGGAVAWTRMRWLIGVGIVSYGFYLWHMPLLILLYDIHPAGGILSNLVIGLPLALLLGLLSWRLVERPALRASARRAVRRPDPVPVPA